MAELSKEALQYLIELDTASTMEIDGRTYSNKKLYPIDEPEECVQAPIALGTLTGLAQYLKSDPDNIFEHYGRAVVHIVSPVLVQLLTPVFGACKQRALVAQCKTEPPGIAYGKFVDAETFNIMLQSRFESIPIASAFEGGVEVGEDGAAFRQFAEDRDALLRIVGNIKEENVKLTGDDGVSQTVTARAGVALVADVKLPNPVMLAPYRTFVELRQPISPFVLRAQQGPEFALFEADGGAWKNDAIERVKGWLCGELSGAFNVNGMDGMDGAGKNIIDIIA